MSDGKQIMPVAATGAMREKLDVPRYDYMPFREVAEAYARVAAHGAEKYEVDNWVKGLPNMQIIGSLLRHSWAYMWGETYDPDSKLLHTDHILWNAVTLVYNVANLPEMDDRFPHRVKERSR